MSYESLTRDHQRLERLNGERKAVALSAPAPVKALQLSREFALAIEQHRTEEQASVYRPLMELSRKKRLSADVDLPGLIAQMEADWSGYLYDWSLECITSDWRGFAEDTIRVLDRAK